MKVILLALTGMGNDILDCLISSGRVQDIILVTRKENGLYPYYACPQIEQTCKGNGIDCHYTDMTCPEGQALMDSFEPDLLVSATFHQILPYEVLAKPLLAINIHPSLLPAYRGATPTNWAVINGEMHSGITIHEMNTLADVGKILDYQKVAIDGLTDGQVRKKLNGVAKVCLKNLISKNLSEITVSPATPAVQPSWYPNLFSLSGYKLLQKGNFQQECLVRGLTPYPGLNFLKRKGNGI